MSRYTVPFASALIIVMLSLWHHNPASAEKPKSLKTPSATLPQTADKETQPASQQPRGSIAKAPYRGAILIDAATGNVLFEDNADVQAYPASISKLMTLLIMLEAVQAHSISLQDMVKVTAAAAKIGGSQVFLKEHEEFSVDELLYALIVQSANDAAVALALHVAGTTDAFVEMMNQKARSLGMQNTVFHSVHGLPPGKGQEPDVTTPRDIAKLCRELLKYPDALRYTATRERTFRTDSPQPFVMRTHNHLLGSFEGCDGFKTGYYRAAGYSIAATATKRGTRVIAVVMGSVDRKQRDGKARELLARGLAELVRQLPPPQPIKAVAPLRPAPETATPKASSDNQTKQEDMVQIPRKTLVRLLLVGAGIIVVLLVVSLLRNVKRKSGTL